MAITKTIQFGPGELVDTWIDSGNPTINYETGTSAVLKGDKPALFRPNLALYGLSKKIKIIGFPTFEIYKTTSSHADTSTRVHCIPIKRDVVINQATWNIFSTGNNWGTAGAKNVTDVLGGWILDGVANDSVISTNYINGTAAEWKTFNLPPSVFDGILGVGSGYFGWLLLVAQSDLGRTATFAFADYTTDITKRPKLTITYEPYHKIFPISAGLGQVR